MSTYVVFVNIMCIHVVCQNMSTYFNIEHMFTMHIC